MRIQHLNKMAQRRMFSLRIVNSAKFLQMSEGAQLLYFHLAMRADDDGIVEAYPVTRLLGAQPDNFKLLVGRGFIRQLNEDQVSLVIDWNEHNTIRADRKVDSIHIGLLKERAPEIKILKAKPRSDVEDNSKRVGGQSTDGIGKVRLGKVKLSKDNTLSEQSSLGKEVNEIIDLFKEVNPTYEEFFKNKTERAAVEYLVGKFGIDKIKNTVQALPGIICKKYAPKITKPTELKRDLGKLVAFVGQENDKKVKLIV